MGKGEVKPNKIRKVLTQVKILIDERRMKIPARDWALVFGKKEAKAMRTLAALIKK